MKSKGEHHMNTKYAYHPDYPRSNTYDPSWIIKHNMGPHPLWLMEWLTQQVDIPAGGRILDLGCGKALTSIFLAEQFDCQVWATDLWINADDNWQRIQSRGLGHQVFPLHCEAHALPYPDAFFDLILSVDSYHYYGTDELYVGTIQKFLKPGGILGIVCPGLHQDFASGIPSYMTTRQKSGGVFWEWECITFHTASWWQSLWDRTPFFSEVKTQAMPDGGALWLQWERNLLESPIEKMFPSDIEVLEADANQYLTFVQAIGRKEGIK